MDIYTNYILNVANDSTDIVSTDFLETYTEYSSWEQTIDLEFRLFAIWEDWQESMRKLSSDYPHMFFTLVGRPEECSMDDVSPATTMTTPYWVAYIQDGKIYHANAMLPPYDPTKMV